MRGYLHSEKVLMNRSNQILRHVDELAIVARCVFFISFPQKRSIIAWNAKILYKTVVLDKRTQDKFYSLEGAIMNRILRGRNTEYEYERNMLKRFMKFTITVH